MVAELPSLSEIEALHERYAPNDVVFDLVWTHCKIVGDIAITIANASGCNADINLIQVGSLLHDIGVYSLYGENGFGGAENYITHGIRGEEILQQEGYDEPIWRFASHHTGVGLTKSSNHQK